MRPLNNISFYPLNFFVLFLTSEANCTDCLKTNLIQSLDNSFQVPPNDMVSDLRLHAHSLKTAAFDKNILQSELEKEWSQLCQYAGKLNDLVEHANTLIDTMISLVIFLSERIVNSFTLDKFKSKVFNVRSYHMTWIISTYYSVM